MAKCLPAIDVISSPVTALPFGQQINQIVAWAKERKSKFVCVANVHMLMEAYWREDLGSVLRQADIVTPDGMPLVWMMRLLGATTQDRVAGLDILFATAKACSETNVSLFFVGSEQPVLSRMRQRLMQEFPQLQIAGMQPLPFRPLTPLEDKVLVEQINNSGAGIVYVSLGCPKQEYWMAQHQGKVSAVMIGLGGAFPVYAGIQKRAPRFIRELGLEWFYRLVQEPKRLWRRYGSTIPPFVWLAMKQLWAHRCSQSQELPS
ncbi:WecB/TagA/CpsF family glycosyltransferase [Almyronema epifaneia]|uniref:WecB/TagA/CpsF family glycosyltransferase n=1 Tax=Almyronema epifaneia S1 TaxID=2991925 RepID=A0ABW6IHM7_9CYAN